MLRRPPKLHFQGSTAVKTPPKRGCTGLCDRANPPGIDCPHFSAAFVDLAFAGVSLASSLAGGKRWGWAEEKEREKKKKKKLKPFAHTFAASFSSSSFVLFPLSQPTSKQHGTAVASQSLAPPRLGPLANFSSSSSSLLALSSLSPRLVAFWTRVSVFLCVQRVRRPLSSLLLLRSNHPNPLTKNRPVPLVPAQSVPAETFFFFFYSDASPAAHHDNEPLIKGSKQASPRPLSTSSQY